MAKQLAFLEYTFILDPKDTFQHSYEFEKFLGEFLAFHGMDGQVIETVAGGVNGKKIILITSIKDMALPQNPTPNPVGRPKSPGSQFKDLSARKLRAPALAFQGKK